MTSEYLNHLKRELATGNALEHSYRPALKEFIERLSPQIIAVNEPSRSSFGAPDFIFLNKVNRNLIYGYAETKDVYTDLDQIEKTEQLKRYLGYSNLILTNYLEFRFFKNGEKTQSITVAKKEGANLSSLEGNFDQLEREIRSFLESKPETITSGKRLAEIMGGKAARIRANVINYLQTESEKNQELLKIYQVMQKLLVHDLEVGKFADMYAQTLVYGLFVARYYDQTPDSFSRQEARDLIPASNPFLQHFFDHIAGPTFDKRLTYIVDELCDVFTVSDVQAIIEKHYNLLDEPTDKDPIIHFYEDFLNEYDPVLRKQMGAYYTPVPVVQFITKAVDEVLKTDFNLSNGLTTTDKIDHQIVIQGKKAKKLIHKVQILDPAVGTATFLNETIKFIYTKFKGQDGLWESYVEKELLPRVHGFELMMAPYTIAHLKLALTLKETGVEHFERRLGVYLTNSLEEGVKIPDDLFSAFGLTEAISEESQTASTIKNDTPIMVVIGNPPYKGESFNKGKFAMQLVEKYKLEPGGNEKLKERNPKWINDDYVKFIAFAQEMVSKTGEGVVAMITNHGYIDNPTFRGMRWNLLTTFSKLYILDLHGNVKKKEVAPDGGKDENVFDIQQGVAIIIAIKQKGKSKDLAEVNKADIWGKRKAKYEFLIENTIKQVEWEKIRLDEPSYAFLNKNEELELGYKNGIKVNELFPLNNVGIVTSRDSFVIDENKEILGKRISNFVNGQISDSEAKELVNESSVFKFETARGYGFNEANIQPIQYRPFDNRFIYYQDYFIERSRKEVMKHFINGENIGLVTARGTKNPLADHFFITKSLTETKLGESSTQSYTFPLYIYSDETQLTLGETAKRNPNLNMGLVKQLLAKIGDYALVNDHENKKNGATDSVSPLDVLDYVYAVLYSPSYRKQYNDFLKSDFPRVPLAKDKQSFWELVKLGGRLRSLHLLVDSQFAETKSAYPVVGNNIVEKVEYIGEKIFINEVQYFSNVPTEAWNFYIGGYQPAQKWLKDRKGKKLSYESITHYQRIIGALTETDRAMKEIDKADPF